MENKERTRLIVGNGIWDLIKPPEPIVLKVEDLYRNNPDCWDLLDRMFVDRPDLQERIEKFKKTYKQ